MDSKYFSRLLSCMFFSFVQVLEITPQTKITEKISEQSTHSYLHAQKVSLLTVASTMLIKMFLSSESHVVSVLEATQELCEYDLAIHIKGANIPSPAHPSDFCNNAPMLERKNLCGLPFTTADKMPSEKSAKKKSDSDMGQESIPKTKLEPKSSAFKTKLRRVYDIVNVLSNIAFRDSALIRKVYLTQTRRFAYVWEGAGVYLLTSKLAAHEWSTHRPATILISPPDSEITKKRHKKQLLVKREIKKPVKVGAKAATAIKTKFKLAQAAALPELGHKRKRGRPPNQPSIDICTHKYINIQVYIGKYVYMYICCIDVLMYKFVSMDVHVGI
jgi:hypothetical protein